MDRHLSIFAIRSAVLDNRRYGQFNQLHSISLPLLPHYPGTYFLKLVNNGRFLANLQHR